MCVFVTRRALGYFSRNIHVAYDLCFPILVKIPSSNLDCTVFLLFVQEKDTEKVLYGLDDIKDASDIIIVNSAPSLVIEDSDFSSVYFPPLPFSLLILFYWLCDCR